MLINDPAVPAPGAPLGDMARLDSTMFHGKAMTYYGRWTYKYEIATEKGAAAAIIIHETGPAGYPYEVVSGSWSRENFDIQTPDKNMKRPEIATEKGAAAAIIIHETGPAGYPYEVVSGSWSRENFDIQTPDKNMKRP